MPEEQLGKVVKLVKRLGDHNPNDIEI